jgi:hypothetical protein
VWRDYCEEHIGKGSVAAVSVLIDNNDLIHCLVLRCRYREELQRLHSFEKISEEKGAKAIAALAKKIKKVDLRYRANECGLREYMTRTYRVCKGECSVVYSE